MWRDELTLDRISLFYGPCQCDARTVSEHQSFIYGKVFFFFFFFFHLYSFFSLPLSMVRSILIAHYWSSPSLKFYRIRSIIPKTFSNKTNPSGKFHFATCAKFVSLNFFEWSLRNYWLLKNKADIIGKRKYEVFELNLYV